MSVATGRIRSSSVGAKSTQSRPNTAYESPKRYVGRLQATASRLPEKPDVNFAKGGSDFRTPYHTSSLGNQVIGHSACRVSIAYAPRFNKSSSLGIGPNLAQISSMNRQTMSARKTSASFGFGTSKRGAELKQYSLYTSTKR